MGKNTSYLDVSSRGGVSARGMRVVGMACGVVVMGWAAQPGVAWAIDQSVPRIGGDVSRGLLSDGAGLKVAILDSGIDDTHPALVGRMVAERNFVPGELGNTGDDVHGHGTAVAAVTLGNGNPFFGPATGASYLNARVLDSGNGFAGPGQVLNGMGWSVANGADVLNMSLGFFNFNQDGSSSLSLAADYIVNTLGKPVVVSAGNNGNNATNGSPNQKPQGPGDGFNVFSVASTAANNYDQISGFSSWGGTSDFRNKPDIAAPGEIFTANDDWETETDYEFWQGTSFAAPHISGMLAQQIGYGKAEGLSIDPRVLKATMLNSSEKVLDRNGNAWVPKQRTAIAGGYTTTSPLDDDSGAGQVDGLALFTQYAAGEFGPGLVPAVGWDLGTISGVSSVTYTLGELLGGSTLSATLNWNRVVGWNDFGTTGLIDSADSFFFAEALDNLNLHILRDGNVIASSLSIRDNVEHLYLTNVLEGLYSIRIDRLAVGGSGTGETYGLAWAGVAIPEPGMMGVVMVGVLMGMRRSRRLVG